MEDKMEDSKLKEFILPYELQFSMRKAELEAQEMTWEQLYSSLMNLYYQRLMEWHALKSLIAEENIKIDFEIPTDIELQKLAHDCMKEEELEYEDEYEDDDENPFLTA